ncbi:MAG: hypothetical protein JSR37_09350 [Verrucomicrobia bacterium]|nr:hypothetical protein [Verrucomicrobiota bacterium]MBS0637066.1 hypothetical protein [Verrucomicrobiota bacterium]
MSAPAPVKSFSSITKGLHKLTQITVNDSWGELHLCLPAAMREKLQKRIQKFSTAALSIDGVYAKFSFVSTPENKNYFEVVAEVAKDIFLQSTLPNLQPGSLVNIGLPSVNPAKWLLDASFAGKVTFISRKIAEGHKHTQELTFECSKDLFERIEKLQYIGLNASGLFLKEPRTLDGRYYFSIHAGKGTREKTMLGQEELKTGTEFTLTLPFRTIN